MTKGETECSEAIRAASMEAKEPNLNVKDTLRKIGAAFLSTREVSSQECVYRCFPELWLRKPSHALFFINTELSEKRICTRKSNQQISELEDDSTDIHNSNIIEKYSDRPSSTYLGNKFAEVDRLCLAEFASYYYKCYVPFDDEKNDNQPIVLTDQILEDQQPTHGRLPVKIPVMSKKETMTCRKVKAVLRFHTPNETTEPEKYCHHLLMLYFPWRKESDLIGPEGTYAPRLHDAYVRQTVNMKQIVFEPYAEAVDEALEYICNNPQCELFGETFDAFAEQENSYLHNELPNNNPENLHEHDTADKILPSLSTIPDNRQGTIPIVSTFRQSEIEDTELGVLVRSLNPRQRYAYHILLNWCHQTVKRLNSEKLTSVDTVYLFITGGAGAGKNHLIKIIYHTATKTYLHQLELQL